MALRRRGRLRRGRRAAGYRPIAAHAPHDREVRRDLARLLDERDASSAKAACTHDIASFEIVEPDAVTCDAAAGIVELTGARTLDALHLASARRIGSGSRVALVTFDVRQAQAARTLGLTVLPG